jgi:hypothetical protein
VQGDRQVEFASGIIRASQFGVIAAQQNARSRVLRHLFQMALEREAESGIQFLFGMFLFIAPTQFLMGT